MMTFSFLKQRIIAFWHNQRGVYMIMVSLLSFVLLGVAALAVDGSGLLLDKARLADSMEQATMALAAENNLNRTDGYKLDQNYSDKGFNKDQFSFSNSKVYQRDQQLIKGYVQAYMPNVKTPYDFAYDCTFRQIKDEKGNIINTPVVCWANGEVKRPSWLFLNNMQTTFDKEMNINSSGIAAIKQSSVIPLDVMVVADLSGSMNYTTNGTNPKYSEESKLTILKSVMNDISDVLLDTNPARASPYNRLGYVSFAMGAQQLNDQNSCILPFYGYNDNTRNENLNIMLSNVNKSATYGRDRWGNIIYYTKPTLNFTEALANYMSFDRTISSIRNFNGKDLDYKIKYPKGIWCLDGNGLNNTTRRWFGVQQKSNFKTEFGKLKAAGATLVSAGVLVGANMIMDKNTGFDIKQIKENTQRILLILSDGKDELGQEGDEFHYRNITKTLIDKGMCVEIRNRMNSLQDSRFRVRPSRIAFVAFGYTQTADQEGAWRRCVGDTNYYQADNKTELLNVFKQIIGFEEEVGRPTFQY